MELLIKHRSEINAVDFKNGTVLHSAVQLRDFETVSLVIGHCSCDTLNIANVKGIAPLHVLLSTFYFGEWLVELGGFHSLWHGGRQNGGGYVIWR